MEYVQELENLKEEINKSGKRIEDLSGLMENFSDLNNIREALKVFREDNVLSRIESKIDIIAQSDSTEIVKLIIDELNDDITRKYNDLSSKIDSLEDVNQQVIAFLGEKKSQSAFLSEEKSEELSEIKEGIGLISSNYRHFLENLNTIQKVIADYKSTEAQPKSIQHFADELKISLSNVDQNGLTELENRIDALLNQTKSLENGFLSGISGLDAKVSNINENLANFNNIDENFESVRQRIDNLAETLRNSGIENLREIAGAGQDVEGIGAQIASEISGNINQLNNNLTELHEEVGRISSSLDQKEAGQEISEKLSFITTIIYELKEITASNNGVVYDENFDQVLESFQSLPKTEFVTEKLSNLSNLFDQIKVKLDDDTVENGLKQGFTRTEESFERIEDILANISAFENIREDLSLLGRNIGYLQEKINDKSDIDQVLGNLNTINTEIETIKGKLPEQTIYTEIKESFVSLSAKVLEVYENLYPIQNLQAVNEGFISAQEKLNIIIENLNNNDVDALQRTLDLDSRFGDLHSKIDTKVAQEVNSVRETLNEALEKINSDIKYSNETGDLLKGDVKYVNLKADGIKDLLDRLIRANSSAQEKTENNFEEVKNALSYLNGELQQVKDSSNRNLRAENFTQTIDSLNTRLEAISGRVSEKVDAEEIKDNIGLLKAEVDYLRHKADQSVNSQSFSESVESLSLKLSAIEEVVNDKTDANDFRELLGQLKSELDHVRNTTDQGVNAANFFESVEALSGKLSAIEEVVNDKTDTYDLKNLVLQFKEEIDFICRKADEGLSADSFKESADSISNRLLFIERNLNDKSDVNELKAFLVQLRQEVDHIRMIAGETVNKVSFTEFSGSLNTRINVLEERISDKEDVNELRESLSQIQNEVNYITQKTNEGLSSDSFTESIDSLNAKLQSIEERINDRTDNSEIKGALGRIQEKINALEELNLSPEEFKLANDRLHSRFDHITGQVEDKNGFNAITDAIESLKLEILSLRIAADKNPDHGELKTSIDTLSQEVNNSTGIKDFSELINYLNTEVQALKISTDENTNLVDNFRESIESLHNKIETFSEITSASTGSPEVIELLNSIREEINSARPVVETNLEPDLSRFSGLFNSINAKLDSLREETGSAKPDESIDIIRQDINALLYKIDENVNKEHFAHSIDALNDRLDSIRESGVNSEEFRDSTEFLSNKIDSLNNRLNSVSSDDELKRAVSSVKEAISALEQPEVNTDELKASIELLSQKLDSLQSQVRNSSEVYEINDTLIAIQEAINTIGQSDSDVSGLKDSAEQINQKLEAIQTQIADNSATEQIREELFALKEAVSGFALSGPDAQYLSKKLDSIQDQVNDSSSADEVKQALISLREAVIDQPGPDINQFNSSIELLARKLDSLQSRISDSSAIEQLKETLNTLKEEINTLRQTGLSSEEFRGSAKNLGNKLDSIQNRVSDSSDTEFLSQKLDSLQAQVSDSTDIDQLRELLTLIKQEINSINTKVENNELTDELKNRLYDLQNVATLNENFHAAQDKLNILIESIANHSPQNIKNELGLENSFNNIRFQIDNQVVNNLSSIKECLGEIQGKQNEADEIKNALQFFKYALDEINENLKYSAKNNMSEEILQTLLNEVNSVKELTSGDAKNAKIDEIGAQINELDQKISGLQQASQFSEIMDFIKENLCQLEEKFNYTNEKISEFARFTEKRSGEEISDVKDQLRSVNQDLSNKIEDNAANINRFLQEFSSKVESLGDIQGVDSLKEGLSILSSSFESVSSNVSALCEQVRSLNDIQEQVENINDRIKIADTSEEISEINQKLDSLTDEISSYKQNLAQLPQNTGEQEFTEILSRLDEITKAVSKQNSGIEKLDGIEEKISGEFGSLGSNIQEVKNRIENLNDSLSGLKQAKSNEEIETNLENGLDEIKELSSRVSDDMSGLKNVMSDLFDAIAGMDNADSHDLTRQKLDQAVERIEQTITNTRPEFDELRSSSNNLTEKLEGLTTDLSGLSEQTRDKLDKFFELSRNIEAKISDSSFNTDGLLDSIKQLSSLSENQFSATNQTLDGIKREFSTIGEELQEFDKDLTDINSKINKLIINSNDNTGALRDKINNSFDNLREDIRQNLQNNAMSLSQANKSQLGELSGGLTEISKKIEGLNSLSVKGFNSSDTLREAVLQMAEWIDSAGQLLEENNESVRKSLDSTDNVLKTVSDSRKNILSQVDRVYNKFGDFEVRLESIEAKIERAAERDNDHEIKQMITDLKGKLPSQNSRKKENTRLIDKIDKLETQMDLFETKIQKILEFVEQEKV